MGLDRPTHMSNAQLYNLCYTGAYTFDILSLLAIGLAEINFRKRAGVWNIS